MGAILEKVRIDFRMRWRSLVALALIIGVSSGILIGAVAAARRTDSVLDRFNASYRLPDRAILISPQLPNPFLPTAEQIRALPGVRKATLLKQIVFPLRGRQRDIGGLIAQREDIDAVFGRVRLLKGRMPSMDRPDEILAGLGAAKKYHWQVGTRIPLGAGMIFKPPLTSLTVAGIFVAVDALPQIPAGGVPFIGTPALFDAVPKTAPYRIEVYLDLGDKAAVAAFQGNVERLAAGRRFMGAGPTREVIIVPTQRAFHLQASALRLLAIIGALSLILVFSQTLSRHATMLASDAFVMRALGMTRRQLWGASMFILGAVGLVGGLVAALVAYVVSPIAPLGDARTIETRAGLNFDATAIGAGALIAFASVIALSAFFSYRAARLSGRTMTDDDARAGEHSSSTADALARAGLSPAAVAGARFAFDRRRGRTALPARTTIAELALCVAGFAMALTCLGGLNYFLDTPQLYGKWWDAKVTFQGADARAHEREILAQPGVTGLAYGVYHDRLVVNGTPMHADRISPPVRGNKSMSVVHGRLPVASDEIAFGAWTMRDLGIRVGQRVNVGVGRGSGSPMPMRVVGVAVFEVTLPLHGLGSGAVISFEAGERLRLAPVPTQAFVLLDERTTTPETFRVGLAKSAGVPVQFGSFSTPSGILNFANMRALPALLAGVLGIFGAATLLHAMLSVVRLRKRDLAILKAIGFDRRQTARTVAWQASFIVIVALAFGIPLGVLGGRFLWLWAVTDVGGVPVTRLPVIALIAIAPVALVAANLVAAIPGRRAASTPAALMLRAE